MTSHFNTKTARVEAMIWTGLNRDAMEAFCPEAQFDGATSIMTLLSNIGDVPVACYDWIVKMPSGLFFVCPHMVFNVLFERVPEERIQRVVDGRDGIPETPERDKRGMKVPSEREAMDGSQSAIGRGVVSTDRCFACDRPLGRYPHRADTRDGQTVFVGRECYRAILDAGETGLQPPKGGPRLWALERCASCGGTDDDPLDCTMDCDDPRPWTEAFRRK